MNERIRALGGKLAEYRYVLIAALAGLLLLMWPSGGGQTEEQLLSAEEQRLGEILTRIEGVGPARVLLSENGVVVVCGGAESPSVRLRVTQALRCYTGLGADAVQIFQTDQNRRDES